MQNSMNIAGVYIHIPFCRSRCSYCDFATGLHEDALAQRYLQAVAKEISTSSVATDQTRIDTIYFGGGTPSLLRPDQLESLLVAVKSRFTVGESVEITME